MYARQARNDFVLAPLPTGMVPVPSPDALEIPTTFLILEVDPVLVGIIAVLLLIVFALFLFIRKTLLNFSEGVREGKRR